MRLIYCITFILLQFSSAAIPQNLLHSNENIRRFADYLFCSQDYLRAVDEYKRLPLSEDLLNLKIAISYSKINEYEDALLYLNKLELSSSLYSYAVLEKAKLFFLLKEFGKIDSVIFINRKNLKNSELNTLRSLSSYSLFYLDKTLPEKKDFLEVYNDTVKNEIETFYNLKSELPYKNPFTAALLSAIIPGLGKIYTEQTGDGITAFISTGLFAFLSYNNFENQHNFRGWLFAGISGLFYAGNIYGSAASAQIYNSQVQFNFRTDLDIFIKSVNFFIEEKDFCK